MTPEERYQYYGLLAEELGAIKTAEPIENEEARRNIKQANFSVYWFYAERNWEGLPPLVRAFFGDEDARVQLATDPLPPDIPSLVTEDAVLNDSQMKALKTALRKPVSLIQGPPGTGKTHTILQIISAILAQGKTVAMVSCNGQAVEDICRKIDPSNEAEPIAEGTEPSNRERLRMGTALLGSLEKRKKFSEEAERREETDPRRFLFQSGSNLQKTMYQGRVYGGGSYKREDTITAERFTAVYPCVISTIHSLLNCFLDGGTFQYDYVIIDEASQVPPYLGVIVMHAAHHLVLVGDDNQLPPVLMSDRLDGFYEVNPAFDRENPDPYLQDTENSLLGLCDKVFGNDNNRVFLNEHYRCHPGIIGFCNQTVYDGRLAVRTKNYDASVGLPIKVIWYEGDYTKYRSVGEEGTQRNSKKNLRQIRIFMDEIYETLVQKLTNEEKSAAILSPYRGQLEELYNAIRAYNERNGIVLSVELNGGNRRRQGGGQEEEENNDALSVLTIHKSQGGEYDVVCLLPVDDRAKREGFDPPWTQKKRLINVATSRAKEELYIITSVNLMPQEVQEQLVSYQIPRVDAGEDDFFLERLIGYVYDYYQDYRDLADGQYGLFRAQTWSVFDRKTYEYEVDGVDLRSAGEDCVQNALGESELIKRYGLVFGHEVTLRDFIAQNRMAKKARDEADADIQNFLDTDAHMDFPIMTAEGVLLLDVEVDGDQHETDEAQRIRDEKKNRFLEETLRIPVIRLRDDGRAYRNPEAPEADEDHLNEIDHIEMELLRRMHEIKSREKYYCTP